MSSSSSSLKMIVADTSVSAVTDDDDFGLQQPHITAAQAQLGDEFISLTFNESESSEESDDGEDDDDDNDDDDEEGSNPSNDADMETE